MLPFILLLSTILKISCPLVVENCGIAKDCGSCANASDISGVKCEWCSADKHCKSFIINECPLEDRIPHPYNCPITIRKDIYNEEFARDIVLPLIGGAHVEPRIELNNLLNKCFKKPRLVNTYEVSCDERTNLTSCYAYMVYLPSHVAIALVFRGTKNLYQLIDEGISFFLYKKVPFKPAGGHADPYYISAFYKLWEGGIRYDFERELKLRSEMEIWCFGHSLGGGLASLAAAHIAYTYHKKDSIRLTTFGQPRIGDIEFAIGHDKLVPNSLRIIHRHDPVPALPPRSFQIGDVGVTGAFHHNMRRGSYYQIGCNADEFSNTVSISSWMDHLTYFEVQLDKFSEVGCSNDDRK